MYADDTVPLYCSESASDLQDTIKNELEDVIAWVKGNRLALNLTYTQYMIFWGDSTWVGKRLCNPVTLKIEDYKLIQL